MGVWGCSGGEPDGVVYSPEEDAALRDRNGNGKDQGWRGRLRFASLICSSIMVLLGGGISALSLLPSDAPGFFLFVGLGPLICGCVGLGYALVPTGTWVSSLLRWLSLIVFALLLVLIGWLLIRGIARGQLVVGAPVLLGLPCLVNAAYAFVGRGRAYGPGQCAACGYDLMGLEGGVCPECGPAASEGLAPSK